MSTTHRVKMAKASQEDLEAGFALNRAFDNLSYGYEPTASDDDENEQRFDIDDHESCRRVLAHLLAIARRGGLMRLVMGLQVLLDPRNEVVDPNLPHLEVHPKHTQAAQERDAALEELAAMRADRDAALLILPACCGSLADAADTLRQERDALLAAVMDATAEFREWKESVADQIEGQENEVCRDHNRMLAALRTLRRKGKHVQNGTRAVVESGSLPAHLERAEQPKPAGGGS